MVLNKILFGKKYGICAFCGRKIKLSESVFHKEHACVCRECNSLIKVAPFGFLYKGTEYVSFIVAPLYYTPMVREAIHNLKFSFMPKVAYALGYYVNTYLSVFEESGESLVNDFDCIIPVPLSKQRRNNRGYNQAELLAREISEAFNIFVDTESLIKIYDTAPQSSLSYAEKKENLKDAYFCTARLDGKRILLVDDVCTTGNTLENCAKVLKENGAASVAAITAVHGGAKKHTELYNELFS